MKARTHILLTVSLTLIAGLACQTGQILTPEEATQRVQATRDLGTAEPGAGGDSLQEGAIVEFVSSNFLINLYAEPGDDTIQANVARGQTGTVQGSELLEGTVWYLVATDAGEGWLMEEFVSRAQAAEGEQDEEIQVGDRVYLTATGFLINFYQEAGSRRIVAGQERGALVTVRAVEEVDGTIWYQVEASTGTGWVPAENLTTEQPGGS